MSHLSLTHRVSREWFAGEVLERGRTVTVTDEMLAANRDRLGNSALDLVDDPEAQVRLWGEQMIARGPFPDDEPIWASRDARWKAEREEARQAAWAKPTESARLQALAEVERTFGPGPTTSTLTARYAGDAER